MTDPTQRSSAVEVRCKVVPAENCLPDRADIQARLRRGNESMPVCPCDSHSWRHIMDGRTRSGLAGLIMVFAGRALRVSNYRAHA